MKFEEIEQILEATTESPRFEFKESCGWDVKIFAKDILALSNTQDGGFIIVGVEDETFIRLGVKGDHRKTYNIEQMRDQIAIYADPHVNFNVVFHVDKSGKEYIIIKVYEFNEIPIVCKKDYSDLKAGAIYYRSNKGKVSSASVSNSHDMRNILDIATVKMMRKKVSLGFSVSPSAMNKFDEELDGL